MRRTLALTLLALAALLMLPAGATAGGPTSVLISEPGERATALYVNSEEYAELERLTSTGPVLDDRSPIPHASYRLTWLVHDVHPWRADDIQIAADGTVAVGTRMLGEGVNEETVTWRASADDAALRDLLERAFAGERTRTREVAAPSAPPVRTVTETVVETRWFSLTGWRWVVPGAAVGLLLGLVAARRRTPDEPRHVLVDAEPTPSLDALVDHRL